MTADLPARTLHFPPDRSAGTLHHTPGGLFSLPGQNELGEARGDVIVPTGAFLTLCVDPAADPIDVSGLANLPPDALDGIVIAYVGFEDRDLRYISGLRGLRLLRLNDINVTDAGLVYLRGLTGLRELQIESIPITDAGIEYLCPLIDLESLEVVQTKITGAALVHIRRLTNLRHLTLSVEDPNETVNHESTMVLSAYDLSHLRSLLRLETLTLYTDISGDGVRHIAGFAHLHRLWISGRSITSANLAHLGRLARLQRLFLWQTGVTDDGLQHLIRLPNLETLWLTEAPITDAGLDVLAGFRSLREINLTGTLVTDAGVARLRSALPECRIYQTEQEFHDDADHVEHVATFRCHTCDAVAGSVMLIRGATGVWRAQHTGGYTVVVSDPLGHVTRWYPAASDALRRALQTHDAPALFALDPDLTRLYCPACDRWYCRTHQTIEERYEDDVPGGWYDATHATCPQGHRRMIDD